MAYIDMLSRTPKIRTTLRFDPRKLAGSGGAETGETGETSDTVVLPKSDAKLAHHLTQLREKLMYKTAYLVHLQGNLDNYMQQKSMALSKAQ